MGLLDGEILALGAMNPGDIQDSAEFLERVGFKGPEFGNEAHFAMYSSGFGEMHTWLERVEVRMLDNPSEKFDAWNMKNSEVYELHNFHARIPRKALKWIGRHTSGGFLADRQKVFERKIE